MFIEFRNLAGRQAQPACCAKKYSPLLSHPPRESNFFAAILAAGPRGTRPSPGERIR